MKILAPTAGPVPYPRTADYVIAIAKKLNAELVLLRILAEKETEEAGEKIGARFAEIGASEKVPVTMLLRRGDIVSAIIEVALEEAVDLILMGASHGEIVAEWMNAKAMERTDIPILLIPKWVSAAKRSLPDGQAK